MLKKWYVFFLCKILIAGAQKSIGLRYKKIQRLSNGAINVGDLMANPELFKFYLSSDYESVSHENNQKYIVIGNGIYQFYEYSSDPRDGTTYREFNDFMKMTKFCAERQLRIATNISMRKDQNYKEAIGNQTSTEFEEWFELHKHHEKNLQLLLSKYLNGAFAKYVNSQVMKLTVA